MSRSSTTLPQDNDHQLIAQQLVDELMKDEPDKVLVRKLSRHLGIPYSMDSMTQINTVLQSIHTVYLGSNKTKPLEG